MKNISTILIFSTLTLVSCGQDLKYPGQLEIRKYRIGDKVNRENFKKHGDIYFPNYLDGWTMNNVETLPVKYKGLPIGIWQHKNDSSVALTLLNDIILNITISYIGADEKERILKMATERFGGDGKEKSYKQTHPLQSWITFWNLKTWETKAAILQIGNSDMRMPNDPIPTNIKWNLVYSDFALEKKIIDEYKKQ